MRGGYVGHPSTASARPVDFRRHYQTVFLLQKLQDLIAADHEEHTSYITTLWPSMAIKVAFNRSRYPRNVYYPAFELVRDGFVTAVDWERFGYEHNEKTGLVTLRASVV
jgi:hypothetical protein